MSTVTTLPFSRSFTRADLEHMPDDGHRYELIDGTLLVSRRRRSGTSARWRTCTCCSRRPARPTSS
jgi:hypothetical protein